MGKSQNKVKTQITESKNYVCRFLNSIDDSVINPLAAELSRFLLNKVKMYLFQIDKYICHNWKMYLFQIDKYICLNWKMYLFQIDKYICLKMY